MAPTYELYTYFRSSCSARVRIAAHYKGIEMSYKFIHLLKSEQNSAEYSALNPSEFVPTLLVTEDGKTTKLTQSLAILEYLEESRPELPLLLPPISSPQQRAKVRELADIVACDIQPVTNSRMLKKAKSFGVEHADWAKEFISAGMKAYEGLVKEFAGKFSVGDTVTLADVCLAPAVDGALRFGVDMHQYPTTLRIYQETQKLDAFEKGSWKNQPDTPEELRGNKS